MLYQEIVKKTQQLDASILQLRKSGTDRAEAEKEYKIKLREQCLILREEGMPIGLIDKTCYGIPEVANLRFKRDIADAVYRANLEAINTLKLELRLLEGQLQREWGQS